MLKGELFSTEMVRAYLEGRKVHTARPIKPNVPNEKGTAFKRFGKGFAEFEWEGSGYLCDRKPKYQPGDFMYCRETFRPIIGVRDDYEFGEIVNTNEHEGFEYKAGGRYWPDGFEEINDEFHVTHIWDRSDKAVWTPSIHMPRSAARLFFRVTKVEVMQLEDVTEEFAREDGFESKIVTDKLGRIVTANAEQAFLRFWKSTYGPSARWMWVYWTELVSKEEALSDGK